MRTREDLTNRTFGRLTAKVFVETGKSHSYWRCECECGNSVVVHTGNLKNRHTRSCGCLGRETSVENRRKQGQLNRRHGESRTYLYRLWAGIHQRCYNQSATGYYKYGGRGITVHPCFAVYEDFREYVLTQLGERRGGQSLDRIDNARGYEPGNLRWASRSDQNRNRRNNHIVAIFGETLCLAEAVEKWGLASYATTRQRVSRHNWPLEKALLTPSRKQKNNSQPINQ